MHSSLSSFILSTNSVVNKRNQILNCCIFVSGGQKLFIAKQLLGFHEASKLEIHAAELASAAGKSSELVKELRRELVEQKKYHEARVQRADATHDREMAQLIEQQGNIEILKVRERTAKLRVRDLENENALLQSQVIELRNGFVQGLQESIPLGDVLPYPDNMERDMEMMGLWNI